MKKCLSFFCCIFLLTGCQQKGWIYREVISDCPQFNSRQLLHIPENRFNGIEVQILEGEFGILGFLNVYFQQIPIGSVLIQINDFQYLFTGIVLGGGQRVLLPQEATETIIQGLLSGQKVQICIEGFGEDLYPENFAKRYSKLTKV